MRRIRTALLGIGTAALIATGTAAASASQPAADAGTDPVAGTQQSAAAAKGYSCTKGAVCFYTGKGGSGTRHKVFANTNRNFTHISSAWNNGYTGSKDHARVKWHYTGSKKDHWGCLSPNEKWTGYDYTVDAVRWANSC